MVYYKSSLFIKAGIWSLHNRNSSLNYLNFTNGKLKSFKTWRNKKWELKKRMSGSQLLQKAKTKISSRWMILKKWKKWEHLKLATLLSRPFRNFTNNDNKQLLLKTCQNLACKIQPVPVKVTLLCLVSHPKAATQFQDAASSKINQQALSIEAVRELILTRPRVKERCSKSWQIEKAQSFRPQRSEVLVQLTFQN